MGKVLVNEIPPLTLSAIRISIAGLFLGVLLKRREGTKPTLRKKHYLLLLSMGFTGIFSFNFFLYCGLQYTTSTNGAIVNAFYPAIALMLSAVFLKEMFNKKQFFGIVCSIFGVVLITIQGSIGQIFTFNINPGDILVLLSAVGWAVYSLLGKIAMEELSPLFVTTYSCIFGLVFLYPGMFIELIGETDLSITWQSVVAIVYISLVVVVAQFLWNKGIHVVGPDIAAAFFNLTPIFTATLAIIFLGEKIHWYHLMGGSLVLIGVLLGSVRGKSNKRVINDPVND